MTFKSEHKVPMDLCPEVVPVDAQKWFGLGTKQLPKFCNNTATPCYYAVKHSYCVFVYQKSVATLPTILDYCRKAFSVYQPLCSANFCHYTTFMPFAFDLIGFDEKITDDDAD